MEKFLEDEEIKELIQKSGDIALCNQILKDTYEICEKENIQFDDYRWKSFVNHIAEMINRLNHGETLPAMELSMFSELSKKSLEIAKSIINILNANLKEEEMYMIAVHIDTAIRG